VPKDDFKFIHSKKNYLFGMILFLLMVNLTALGSPLFDRKPGGGQGDKVGRS
jgi:hypothetical protein